MQICCSFYGLAQLGNFLRLGYQKLSTLFQDAVPFSLIVSSLYLLNSSYLT